MHVHLHSLRRFCAQQQNQVTELETVWSAESKVCALQPWTGRVCQPWSICAGWALRIQMPVRNGRMTRQPSVPNAYESMGICCCCCFGGGGRIKAFNLQDFIQTFFCFNCHSDVKVLLRSHLWPVILLGGPITSLADST